MHVIVAQCTYNSGNIRRLYDIIVAYCTLNKSYLKHTQISFREQLDHSKINAITFRHWLLANVQG